MSRSVATHSDSVETVYFNIEGEIEEDYDWRDFIENLRSIIRHGMTWAKPKIRGFPSMDDADRWEDRELRVIVENGHAFVTVAEYNGVVAVDLVPKAEDAYGLPRNVSIAWTHRAALTFRKLLREAYPGLVMISKGRASNGEQFFELVSTPGSVVTSKEGRLPMFP